MGVLMRKGVAYGGSNNKASALIYNNTKSGLEATNAQTAIDEVHGNLKAADGTVFRFAVNDEGEYGFIVNDEFMAFGSGGSTAQLFDALKYSGLVTSAMTFEEMCNVLAETYPQKCTITYVWAGKTSTEEYYVEEDILHPKSFTPVLTDAVFLGWSTNKNDTTVQTNLVAYGNTTLYAVFQYNNKTQSASQGGHTGTFSRSYSFDANKYNKASVSVSRAWTDNNTSVSGLISTSGSDISISKDLYTSGTITISAECGADVSMSITFYGKKVVG